MARHTGLVVETQMIIRRNVPDHQVLIVFDDDEDAYAFRDWLFNKGFKKFAKQTDREVLIHT